MIFAMLGTTPCSFSRLAEELDRYSLEKSEDILIQLGYTAYKPENLKFFRFGCRAKMLEIIKSAEIVVTHGGYGSIYDCLELKKRVIAAPRKKELHECYDPGLGQEELVRKLERENRIIALYEVGDLASAVQKARTFTPNFDLKNEVARFLAERFGQERYRSVRV